MNGQWAVRKIVMVIESDKSRALSAVVNDGGLAPCDVLALN